MLNVLFFSLCFLRDFSFSLYCESSHWRYVGCILLVLILAFIFVKDTTTFLPHPTFFAKFLLSLRALG